jgi:hypothetical protein
MQVLLQIQIRIHTYTYKYTNTMQDVERRTAPPARGPLLDIYYSDTI